MPRTKTDHPNSSAVARETADGVFYENGRYLCRRLENGTPCNREMAGTAHSIGSHNSDFHKEGRYQLLQAEGDYKCIHDDCKHRSCTFNAILGHIRNVHGFRGSSDSLKLHYGIPIHNKRKREGKAEEKSGCKKQRQEAKETAPEVKPQAIPEPVAEGRTQETKEGGSKDSHQEPKEHAPTDEPREPGSDELEEFMKEYIDFDTGHNHAADDEFLSRIDPRLRQWDRDNAKGGAGR
ncbi:hypothetical protein O1611_g7403 [Lasiodiplodia mahajangana]|uniref:Uncharacterized protein n=1 Tax=Lasiodiplodia mahajangana TaxID=1108764 RepID=A0ACC2JFP5_9PEZI|nr:hypothetical protein O1611_g7403 [Lasiodiplodia mahajangana]